MEENKKYCRDCGREIKEDEDFIEYNGEYVCMDCEDNYFYCEECENFEHRDYGYWINSESRMICENCVNNYYTQCADCEEYFRTEEMERIYDEDGDYKLVCDECRDSYYYCENCGHFCENDNIHDTYNGMLCTDCCDNRHSQAVYGYHEFRDWKLFKGENEANVPYYIGKEIELDPLGCGSSDDVEDLLEIMNNNINAVGMHDGSLDDYGVEVVTHPESYQYLLEHKENYRKFFEEIEGINYGNDGRCGLHFHVSRPNDDVIARIIVIMESFKDEIIKLSRRSERQISNWAKFLTDSNSDGADIKYKSSKYLKEKYINYPCDRYYALNLENSKTIEFRFFDGVNNFEEFWGALQFIHNIMEIALSDKQINQINWKDLMIGDELREQARNQNVLGIDKFAEDTTEILDRYLEEIERVKKEIKKILGNLTRYVNKEMSEVDLKKIKSKNYVDVQTKCNDFIRDFQYRLNYLNRVVDLYIDIENENLDMIKFHWNNIKNNYPVNAQRYKRYDKLIEKALKSLKKEEK